jgi:hypothetical protein
MRRAVAVSIQRRLFRASGFTLEGLAQTAVEFAGFSRRVALRHVVDWKLGRVFLGMVQGDRDFASDLIFLTAAMLATLLLLGVKH